MSRLRRYLRFAVCGKAAPPSAVPRKVRRGPARDGDYRSWVRSLPSVISGLFPCDAAHTGSDGGMGMKASDYSCIPLTRVEHCELHRIGKEAFERKHQIVMAAIVRDLNCLWFEYLCEVT